MPVGDEPLTTMNVPDVVIKRLTGVLREMRESLDAGKDFRIVLARVPELQNVCRGMIDVAEDAETRFAFMLCLELQTLLKLYEGKTQGWYALNADLIKSLAEKMSSYFKRLEEGFEQKNYEAIVEGSKVWFSDFHLITRKVTADVTSSE